MPVIGTLRVGRWPSELRYPSTLLGVALVHAAGSHIAPLGHLSEHAGMNRIGVSPAVRDRYAGWAPEVLLVLGLAATIAELAALVIFRNIQDPLWSTAGIALLVASVVVRWQRPDLPASAWFALGSATGPLIGLTETATIELVERDTAPTVVAWLTLVGFELGAVGILGTAYLIGLFPDGRAEKRWHRWAMRAVWPTLLVPPFVVLASARVPISSYLELPAVPNSLHVLPGSLSYDAGLGIAGVGAMALPASAIVLVVRYRQALPAVQERIRWLLLPVVLVAIGFTTNVLLGESARIVTWISLLIFTVSLAVGGTFGILQPARIDVDRMLRRVLVYGVLWLLIAGAYAATAAVVGVTAGQYLPVGWAVAIALFAAVAFQPARTRLERLADRWVFGRRTDPAEVIAQLGSTLAETFDLASLLPRMTAALEDGLGLTWARVRLHDQPEDPAKPAAVAVPIVLDGEQIGVVECGPKQSGSWTDEDQAVVTTFARQAALAVHNVRLTERLAGHVDELAASRTRLVRAQERERRTIERNIHDGVQQDLVALIGLAGQLQVAPGGAPAIEADLSTLQTGLTRVLGEVRDLASGIHPSLLTDQGLLAAVEALTARHPVAVDLRADPSIRDERFAEDAEAACYFTVAEALANSLKHARARSVEVTLARRNGSLLVTVSDDGVGFDAAEVTVPGRPPLSTLRDRLAALDGTLTVASEPGSGTTVAAEVAMQPVGMA